MTFSTTHLLGVDFPLQFLQIKFALQTFTATTKHFKRISVFFSVQMIISIICYLILMWNEQPTKHRFVAYASICCSIFIFCFVNIQHIYFLGERERECSMENRSKSNYN